MLTMLFVSPQEEGICYLASRKIVGRMLLQGVWLASPISDAASILITVAVISRELHWLNQKIKQQKIQFVIE